MAKEKKESKPLFSDMHFDDVAFAQDVYNSSTKKMQRCKIGLIVAAVAEVIWILLFLLGHKMGAFGDILSGFALVASIASYIVGGGIKMGLSFAWRVSTKVGFFGWLVVPFPYDILTGLMCTCIGIMLIPTLLLFIPLVLVGLNYIQIKKDYDAAQAFLSYYKPVIED